MADQTELHPVDLNTTTLANVAELFAERISRELDDTVRRIVREELDRQRQGGES
jgi:hypothetical protein